MIARALRVTLGGVGASGGDEPVVILSFRLLAETLWAVTRGTCDAPTEDIKVIVADDRAAIEADLPPGRLCCPHCRVGVLEAGGRALVREVDASGTAATGAWRERERLRTFRRSGWRLGRPVRYLSSEMPKELAQCDGEADRHVAGPDGWHELAVANPTFLLERLGSECTDLQGLRELTVNGLDAIAALGADVSGRVVWDLDWERFDASGGRVRKLSVIDTGTGMTAEQLRYYINQLAASGREQSPTGNFGVGAKVAAGSRNPHGAAMLFCCAFLAPEQIPRSASPKPRLAPRCGTSSSRTCPGRSSRSTAWARVWRPSIPCP